MTGNFLTWPLYWAVAFVGGIHDPFVVEGTASVLVMGTALAVVATYLGCEAFKRGFIVAAIPILITGYFSLAFGCSTIYSFFGGFPTGG
ncbi:MAG: hypothetical protein WAV48_02245 [Candidatus Magasanikiibacteriota bacterium]